MIFDGRCVLFDVFGSMGRVIKAEAEIDGDKKVTMNEDSSLRCVVSSKTTLEISRLQTSNRTTHILQL